MSKKDPWLGDFNWIVHFDEVVVAVAIRTIKKMYPDKGALENKLSKEDSQAKRNRMLDYLDAFIHDLETNPLEVLGAPPKVYNSGKFYRFPATKSRYVSGIAEVDIKAKVITLVEIHVKALLGKTALQMGK